MDAFLSNGPIPGAYILSFLPGRIKWSSWISSQNKYRQELSSSTTDNHAYMTKTLISATGSYMLARDQGYSGKKCCVYLLGFRFAGGNLIPKHIWSCMTILWCLLQSNIFFVENWLLMHEQVKASIVHVVVTMKMHHNQTLCMLQSITQLLFFSY